MVACEDLGTLISRAKEIQATAPKSGLTWVTTTYQASESNAELEGEP